MSDEKSDSSGLESSPVSDPSQPMPAAQQVAAKEVAKERPSSPDAVSPDAVSPDAVSPEQAGDLRPKPVGVVVYPRQVMVDGKLVPMGAEHQTPVAANVMK